jgi:hypothetical protein
MSMEDLSTLLLNERSNSSLHFQAFLNKSGSEEPAVAAQLAVAVAIDRQTEILERIAKALEKLSETK